MSIGSEDKKYLEQILAHPVDFDEVLEEEKAEKLNALGFDNDTCYVFMLNPLITSSKECHHLNPRSGTNEVYTLVSDEEIVVFTGRKGVYEAHITSRISERKFTSNTKVYPMYLGTDYGSLVLNLSI